MLAELFSVIESRKADMPEGSYTVELLQQGQPQMLRKVGEEALEVILAAQGEGDQRLIEEVADLFYHTLVLLAGRDLTLAQVEAELRRRHQPSE